MIAGLNSHGFFESAEDAHNAIPDFKAYARSNNIETDYFIYRLPRGRGFTLLPKDAKAPKAYTKINFSATKRNPLPALAGLLKAHAVSVGGGMLKNPAMADEQAAHELYLFAVNDANLYRQRILPIIANLKKKKAKGVYDASLALKLWKYAADDAAKRYNKEYSGSVTGYGPFSVATRMETAKHLADHYIEHIRENPSKRKQRKTTVDYIELRAVDGSKIAVPAKGSPMKYVKELAKAYARLTGGAVSAHRVKRAS